MSDEQLAKAVARAAEEGMTVPRLLAGALDEVIEHGLGSRVSAVAQLLELTEQVYRAGNVANQIAKVQNSYGRPIPEAGPALAALEEAALTLNELAREVMGLKPAVRPGKASGESSGAVPAEWAGVDDEQEG